MPMDGGIPFRDHMAERAARLRDLTPAFKVIGDEAVKRTAAAFATETDPNTGERWAELADSTKRARLRHLKPDAKGKRRDRAGRFATGIVKKLDETGRLRRAALRMQVSMAGTQWFIPRYGRAHAKGTATMPRRQWTVFEAINGGKWRFEPEFLGYVLRILGQHARGEPLR